MQKTHEKFYRLALFITAIALVFMCFCASAVAAGVTSADVMLKDATSADVMLEDATSAETAAEDGARADAGAGEAESMSVPPSGGAKLIDSFSYDIANRLLFDKNAASPDCFKLIIELPYTYQSSTIALTDLKWSWSFDIIQYDILSQSYGNSVLNVGSDSKLNELETATLTFTYYLKAAPKTDPGDGGDPGDGSDPVVPEPEIYTTEYKIQAYKITPVKATFTGTVSKNLTLPTDTISFDGKDFNDRYKSEQEGAMTGIAITGESNAIDKIKIDGAAYTAGALIPLADIGSKLKFVSQTSGTFAYKVYAFNALHPAPNDKVGEVILTVVVNPRPEEPSSSLSTITYDISSNEDFSLNDNDFNSAYRSLTGKTLDYVRISQPSSSNGRLYYNYTSYNQYDYEVKSTDNFYYRSSPRISNVSFVPRDDYVGTVNFNYTAYGEDGGRYSGTVRVYISNSGESGSSGTNNTYVNSNTVTYYTDVGKPVFLSADDFAASMISSTGYTLSYIRIITLPLSSNGRLQYDYSSSSTAGSKSSNVTTDARYYRNSSPEISNLFFTPTNTFYGTLNIPYTAYSTVGTAYGGTLYIRVGQAASTYALGDMNYSLKTNAVLKLSASDFQDNLTKTIKSTLSYIMFRELPDAGSLYYNYRKENDYDAKVTTGSRYYRNTNPIISSITFAPKAGQNGSVTIPYTAYTTAGQECPGKIIVKLESAGNLKALTYQAIVGAPLSFLSAGVDADVRELVKKAAGSGAVNALSHVEFEVPPASAGVIYKNYQATPRQRQSIKEGEQYYDRGSPAISELTFVPASADGKTQLAYTAFTASGATYIGKITLKLITPPDGWARDEVSSLATRGVIPDTLLKNYESTITRAEFTALLVKTYDYSGSNAKRAEPRDAAFGDIRGNPYARQITRGYSLGIIDGVSAASFEPNSPLTREAAAKILCAAVALITGSPIESTATLSFADADGISDWAAPFVAFANEKGLMIGDNANRFNPQDNLTREEAMALVERAIVKFNL